MAFMSEPPCPGCQLWLGGKDKDGYGLISIGNVQHRATRVALSLKLGRPLAVGMLALHTCHTPACVQQDHLYEGSNDENMVDKVLADRQWRQRGELCPTSKLTAEQVLAIRADPRSMTVITKDYPVCYGTIYAIKRRRIWAHI